MIKTLTKNISRVGLAASALVMVAAGTVFLAPPAPAAAGYTCNRPELWQGKNNVCVKFLQIMLNNVKPATASKRLVEDGKFGPLTHNAVREYQRDEDIRDDGIVGRITWGRLCYEVGDHAGGLAHYVPSYWYNTWFNAKVNIC